ncbi:related to Glutamyl-tRNA(Gln) amidotransferase subunit A, mitochondrial [Ramularia collo-cygni]|uniref:Glutamyl-tRNA(Gln) amidotransferase subunit A, mitochondrial n=1 Tax=Ramularia collo-cygni TaxID=112498 RepID=A0A2D3ULY2_9PEZI|nr:related to Glutamyl-tRNA(Gln) amidotransferase subunit A, mitochondrial [Ramularia collo-cygni]CZT15722.1 related to Glutamyl-tRNA(Gln) amidotransferase subunit A, mitochondrial [Ramularia collo-cygni]
MPRLQSLGQNASRLCKKRQFTSHVTSSTTTNPSPPAKPTLAGKTIGIKANIVTGNPHAASKTLANYATPFDATVVELLKEQGAMLHPGQNMDEFGMGSHSQNSYHGSVKGIFHRGGMEVSPGGSSGGSAISVAKGECWTALGTDTGGSVRLPAAYMGIVGFKPSYGRVSRWGVVQYANSLDTVGILGRDVRDVWKVFGCLDRWDGRDPTSLGVELRKRLNARRGRRDVGSLRIGIPMEYNLEEVSSVVRETYARTLSRLQAAGHTLVPVSLPTTRLALSAYYILAPAEASSNLAKYDGIRYGHRTDTSDASPNADPALPLYAQTRGESFGAEVKRRILLGAYNLSSEAMDNYFLQAQKVRRMVQRDFDRVFTSANPLLDTPPISHDAEEDKVDLLLMPTAPTLPPTVEELKKQSTVQGYMNDVFTVPASLAGLPAISLPVPLSERQLKGMDDEDVKTVGMQLVGQFGDDRLLLSAAAGMAEVLAGREEI